MMHARPKGTFDILPYSPGNKDPWKSSPIWDQVGSVCRELSHLYGFSEISTPIFESTSLFTRAVGENSDVSKEMYQFLDKGKRALSLRPEGTAGVVRAFIENGMHQLGSSHKFFYMGPFFRYDRPQAGRYRQFHQFGAESFGVISPERDFETIMMLYSLYTRLGLTNLNVLMNCLGSASSRNEYITKLKLFLQPHISSLSADSQRRLTHNPLRILDTKDPQEILLLEKAPSILDCITSESRAHFETVTRYLKEHNVPITISPRLVRGLDYYNETVFEITSNALGAQNSLGGGGRYDHLMKQYGGPDLPAIGFATGIERIILTMIEQKVHLATRVSPFFNIIAMEPQAKPLLTKLLQQMREAGLAGDMIEVKKIQKGLAETSKKQAAFAIIVGSQEWDNESFQLKCMKSGTLTHHALNEMGAILKEQSSNYET